MLKMSVVEPLKTKSTSTILLENKKTHSYILWQNLGNNAVRVREDFPIRCKGWKSEILLSGFFEARMDNSHCWREASFFVSGMRYIRFLELWLHVK